MVYMTKHYILYIFSELTERLYAPFCRSFRSMFSTAGTIPSEAKKGKHKYDKTLNTSCKVPI